jgi:hypothetical protein
MKHARALIPLAFQFLETVESSLHETRVLYHRVVFRDDSDFLLGNTRSLEARVYTRLTQPVVQHRTRPTSLDLLYLLGSRQRAPSIVSAERLDAVGYDEGLDSLTPEAATWIDATRPMSYRSSLERARLLWPNIMSTLCQ